MGKQIESTADSGRTIQGLVMEANDLAFGVEHLAENFELSPLWQAPTWTEVANGYLDLSQWGPPPWTELQWVTLRNVIELAQEI